MIPESELAVPVFVNVTPLAVAILPLAFTWLDEVYKRVIGVVPPITVLFSAMWPVLVVIDNVCAPLIVLPVANEMLPAPLVVSATLVLSCAGPLMLIGPAFTFCRFAPFRL